MQSSNVSHTITAQTILTEATVDEKLEGFTGDQLLGSIYYGHDHHLVRLLLDINLEKREARFLKKRDHFADSRGTSEVNSLRNLRRGSSMRAPRTHFQHRNLRLRYVQARTH